MGRHNQTGPLPLGRLTSTRHNGLAAILQFIHCGLEFDLGNAPSKILTLTSSNMSPSAMRCSRRNTALAARRASLLMGSGLSSMSTMLNCRTGGTMRLWRPLTREFDQTSRLELLDCIPPKKSSHTSQLTELSLYRTFRCCDLTGLRDRFPAGVCKSAFRACSRLNVAMTAETPFPRMLANVRPGGPCRALLTNSRLD